MNHRLPLPRFHLWALLVGLCWMITIQAREPEFEALAITTAAGETIAYQVEVARTPARRQRGLMFRDQLPADQGMLFIYEPEGIARMWMKNTILSLDMLFITGDGRIATIHENTVPFSLDTLSATEPVRAVLELNAGQVREHGISLGDRVSHPLFDQESP